LFPFIWWLGAQASTDDGQHEGGEDFLRRRVLMATSVRRNSMPLSALAWFYAAPQYVEIDGSELVATWRDRGPNGLNLSAALAGERPSWESAGGWSASKSSIFFPGGKNLGNGFALGAFFNGEDVPFWMFATCAVTDLTTERTIASWDDSVGLVAQSKCSVSATDGFSQYRRVDDASGSALQTATGNGCGVGTRRRMGWSFNGTQITTYMDQIVTLNNAAADVGTLTANRLRVGDGNGPGADSFLGRIVEIVIGVGAATVSDWTRYYSYSLGEWGA
jgi:hypothetical protein